MAYTNPCTQFGNYGPRKIHISGIKYDPYDWTLYGLYWADGKYYTGGFQGSPQPAPGARAYGVPICRTCHGGC